MAIHCTMTYYGDEEDSKGMPKPWIHYLVVASPGPKENSGIASIISLSETRASKVAQGPSHVVMASEGGPAAAINKAEELLDKEHPKLKKIISECVSRSEDAANSSE